MFKISHKGNFEKTTRFLNGALRLKAQKILERYARAGVAALASATPYDTGGTANAWGYRVSVSSRGYSIAWTNSNSNDGVPIAILLQYGHATRSGGYVQGRDFINPAIRPIFDQISSSISQEIANL